MAARSRSPRGRADTHGGRTRLLAAGALAAACVARSGELPEPVELDGDDDPVLLEVPTPEDPLHQLPPLDPHDLVGIDPPHGPPSGGRAVLVRGSGFGGDARVWFGDTAVPDSDVVAVDATRLQVVTPPGAPGPAALTVQNGDDTSTRRTLSDAYTYDAFEVSPARGTTAGGTRLELSLGVLAPSAEAATVTVDDTPCTDLEVVEPGVIRCTTPPGTPGAKAIRLATSDGAFTVLDAFTYGDSDDGYRGGLAGEALDTTLTVLVLDGTTGAPLPGAAVVIDAELTTATSTGKDGRADLALAGSAPTRTVTAAAPCHQPMTLVDVPVDHVTLYLDPVLTPACGDLGDLPAGRGSGADAVSLVGELLWPEVNEFQRPPFGNVPAPARPTARRAAYVLIANASASRGFTLPGADQAVTEDTVGVMGSTFTLPVLPGIHTLYALAGIEDRSLSPPSFVAYTLGLLRGVNVGVDGASRELFIDVVVPLDHALTIDVTAPTPSSRGPDRLVAKVGVKVGDGEHLALPVGPITRLLPTSDPIEFVGLPPLVGPLAGATYVTEVRAVTGSAGGEPSSELGVFAGGSTGVAWEIEGFLEVPALVSPAPSGAWDGSALAVEHPPGGRAPSLTYVEIASGDDLVTWTVVLPAGVTATELPALDALGEGLGLVRGPLTVVVTSVVIPDFDYATWSYADLSSRRWEAHARDEFFVHW